MVTEPGGCDFLHGSSLQGTLMLFSLIHPGTGSSSQSKLDTFELVRLIQSLFGYHHLTPSLMEPRCTFGAWQSQRALPKPTLLLTDLEIATLRPPHKN